MKLRIQNDAIRFRPTRSETARLGDGLGVESTCHFPGGRMLAYASTLADRTTIDARFDGDRVEIVLPRDRTVE